MSENDNSKLELVTQTIDGGILLKYPKDTESMTDPYISELYFKVDGPRVHQYTITKLDDISEFEGEVPVGGDFTVVYHFVMEDSKIVLSESGIGKLETSGSDGTQSHRLIFSPR